MNFRTQLAIGLLLVAGLRLAAASEPARPNILIILADDMGVGDVSALNPKSIWRTPNIDRIGNEEGHALRRLGRPMQQIDIQIAAIALALGNCTVVSRDSDLTAIPDLSVEDWSIRPPQP